MGHIKVRVQRQVAHGIFSTDDHRIDIDRRTTGRDQASRTNSRASVRVGSEFLRDDEAEAANGAEFVFVDRCAVGVLGNRNEVIQTADVVLAVGVGKDHEASFDCAGVVSRAGGQDLGLHRRAVRQQGAGDQGQAVVADLLIDSQASRAASVLDGRSGLHDAVADHFTNQRHTLGNLHHLVAGDVVFVEQFGLVGVAVQATVLLDLHIHVTVRQSLGCGRNAFSDLMRSRGEGPAVHTGGGGASAAGRDASAIGDVVALVAGHFLHRAAECQDFVGFGETEHFTFDFIDATNGGRVSISSHD